MLTLWRYSFVVKLITCCDDDDTDDADDDDEDDGGGGGVEIGLYILLAGASLANAHAALLLSNWFHAATSPSKSKNEKSEKI